MGDVAAGGGHQPKGVAGGGGRPTGLGVGSIGLGKREKCKRMRDER